jgi:hypothetical protein
MNSIRMILAALVILGFAAPVASAATPPEQHAPAAVAHVTLRSPGHPSERASAPPADPAPAVSPAGTPVDRTPIVFTAGVGLVLLLGAGMVSTRRGPPSAIA